MSSADNPLALDVTAEDPAELITMHGADRLGDLEAIAESMQANGWQGAPLVVHLGTALTGVHRIAAALKVGLAEVPTVQAGDLFHAAGVAFDADRGAYDLAPELEALYDELPEPIRTAYGLDS